MFVAQITTTATSHPILDEAVALKATLITTYVTTTNLDNKLSWLEKIVVLEYAV
jgi:hypothetical protein